MLRVHVSLCLALAIGAAGCKDRSQPKPSEDQLWRDAGSVDPAEQAAAFDKQCVAGDLEACRQLATDYLEGKGVSQDLRRATTLFAQACSGNNMSACNAVALAYSEGIGIPKDPQRAIESYQKACDGGYAPACRNLGLVFRDGRGVPADLPRAELLLDKACRGGVPFACTNAGDLEAKLAVKSPGRMKRAVSHYKRGCDNGDPTACRQLGIAYLEGKGLPRSPSAAAVWLQRGCVPDEAVACRLLGAMLLQGNGVPRDAERGKQLLARACEAKDEEACRLVQQASEPAPGDAGVPGAAPDGGAGGVDAGSPRAAARMP